MSTGPGEINQKRIKTRQKYLKNSVFRKQTNKQTTRHNTLPIPTFTFTLTSHTPNFELLPSRFPAPRPSILRQHAPNAQRLPLPILPAPAPTPTPPALMVPMVAPMAAAPMPMRPMRPVPMMHLALPRPQRRQSAQSSARRSSHPRRGSSTSRTGSSGTRRTSRRPVRKAPRGASGRNSTSRRRLRRPVRSMRV